MFSSLGCAVFLKSCKFLAVLFMLFAFVGQAIAVTSASCNMEMQHEKTMIDKSTDNSSHMMSMDDDIVDSNSMDCEDCDDVCSCPMSGCATTLFNASRQLSISFRDSSQKIKSPSFAILNSHPESTYRPPITC